MAKPTYYEQLKDPRWQRKRLEILERDEFACCDCGDKNETLHVHHSFYRKGLAPWEYDAAWLRTLCATCHEWAEWRRELLLRAFGMLGPESQAAVTGFAIGQISGNVMASDIPHVAHFCDPADDDFLAVCKGVVASELHNYFGPQAEQSARCVAESVMDGGPVGEMNRAAFSIVKRPQDN